MTRPESQPADGLDELRRFLASPQAYPEPTTEVTRVETHISLVFLTDHFAYKLKKPVRYEFLDFSTVEDRHDDCLTELRLNRRLAADVYLDVVPVTRSAVGRLAIGGDGPAIDWLVKMRRLNAAATLSAAIGRGAVATDEVSALAETLAAFYRRQPALPLSADAYRAQLERHLRANLAELSPDDQPFPPRTLRRILSAQVVYLMLMRAEFDARVAAGRLVDGHGDLRPEHIYFTPEPVVIDCVEFNAEFRRVDRLEELAFLESECTFLEAAQIGRAVREQCLARLDDRPPERLVAFHKTYRACVRAKVALLRSRQVAAGEAAEQMTAARRYLQLAGQFCDALGPPLLLLVRGWSGTGKSTLARALADRWEIDSLETDALRQRLVAAGKLPTDVSEKYHPANRQQVYDALFASADELLAGGSSVILDGTFLARQNVLRAEALAAHYHARWLILDCQCPEPVARERVASRRQAGRTLSEATPALVAGQSAAREEDLPHWPILRCDTTRPLPTLIEAIAERLRGQ